MAHVTEVDQATFQKLLASDPDVQKVIQGVWGNTPINQRPGDTPKNLEKANDAASKQISQILASKGVKLPNHTFINPRTASLEPEHGWAGLPTAAKIAIIAGAGAAGIWAAPALMAAAGGGGAASGGAAAASAIPSVGVTSGIAGSVLPGVATGVGGAAAAGGAGVAGTTAAGLGAKAGLMSTIGKSLSGAGTVGKIAGVAGPLASGIAASAQKGREATNAAAADAAAFKLKESQDNETNLQNRAGLDLKQRQFGMDSNNNAFKNAMRSAVAKNVQDVSYAAPPGVTIPTVSGGLRPSAMGQEGRDAAGVMNSQAMLSLMNGEKFDALPPLERTAPATYKSAGALENIAGTIGMGAGAINGANAQTSQQTMQQKIMDAIAKLSGPQAPAGPVRTSTVPPPQRAPVLDPYADGDQSNR